MSVTLSSTFYTGEVTSVVGVLGEKLQVDRGFIAAPHLHLLKCDVVLG